MTLPEAFSVYFETQVRRVLTQLDRDPNSSTYGCFDRNYWHYKIRDFPSSILQQGVFVLEHLRRHGTQDSVINPSLAEEWTLAAINALSRQVGRKGDVSEYFPHEDSYPASAFGLYAIVRILSDWRAQEVSAIDRVEWNGLSRLVKHLVARVESQASNQYAAAVAALALATEFPELEISKSEVSGHADRLFSLQHSEGWFEEYGGPDFGYLTVTIDTLVDYFEVTADARATAAIDRAVDFLVSLVGSDNELPWTLNSRNTDYVVPYGLVRTAVRSPRAAWLVEKLFSRLGESDHPIWATDDRYHLHYIFASITRSLPLLESMTPSEEPQQQLQTWLPGCGYAIFRHPDRATTVYVAAYKGGLVRLHGGVGDRVLADHGWRVRQAGRMSTTNWWQSSLKVDISGTQMIIRGALISTSEMPSTPFLHFGLRMTAFIFGNTLTPLLKKLMIFRSSRGMSMTFERRVIVQMDNHYVDISDRLNLPPGAEIWRSPRQNLRHVASADSFSVEEFGPLLEPKRDFPDYIKHRLVRDYDS
jgi:hypothetical protein